MLRSLRLRLLLLLLATLSISTGLSTIYSYHEAQHEIRELFDAQLAQEARIIYTNFLYEPDTTEYQQLQKTLEQNARLVPRQSLPGAKDINDDTASPYGHVYERKIAFQVWDKAHRLVLRSFSAPQEPLSQQGLSPGERGYHDVILQGKKWRVFTLWHEQGRHIVQTGEEYDIRNELAQEISLRWILITGLTLPLIIIMVMLAIHYGFSPLRSIIRQIRERDPQYLKPIIAKGAPDEVQPLLDELNRLFLRISATLEKERRFTDDAAHELRTPLAALKTQAQIALRTTVNEERTHALHKILQSVDRLTHLIQQLLNLARLGAGKINIQLAPINVYSFSNEVLSQLAPSALGKHIELEMLNERDPGLVIMAEETCLGMLLRNIIDNAIRYTPANGRVQLQIQGENSVTELCITDTGSGIPAELQERVFDRFYRIAGSGETGCGLGLAIARHCAELLHAGIYLATPEQGTGLRVCIRFQH